MPAQKLKTVRMFLGWSAATLGILSVVIVGKGIMSGTELVQGALVRQPVTYKWVSVSAEKIMSGATLPANAHVVFHLPEGFKSITRETLLGHEGDNVRYWGYCFAANYDPRNVDRRRGFPGLIFLSEKERAFRAAEARAQVRAFDPESLPTVEEIEAMNRIQKPVIRHQLEVFKPSTMCYIMTEDPLPIGLDMDGDRLNTKMEKEIGTHPTAPDSDGDCLIDGIEYQTHTNPIVRDTDGDALVDGIEDSNCNGRIDPGETDPRSKDFDRDELCDGVCRVRLKNQFIFIGEDKNLNGEVDEGETDPGKWDSNGNGVSDHLETIRCIAEGKEVCP
jgi:hypothetical protein